MASIIRLLLYAGPNTIETVGAFFKYIFLNNSWMIILLFGVLDDLLSLNVFWYFVALSKKAYVWIMLKQGYPMPFYDQNQ